jgi:hypothetical protein
MLICGEAFQDPLGVIVPPSKIPRTLDRSPR